MPTKLNLIEHPVKTIEDFERMAAIRNQWRTIHQYLPRELVEEAELTPSDVPVHRWLLSLPDGTDVASVTTLRLYWGEDPHLFQAGFSFQREHLSEELFDDCMASIEHHTQRLGGTRLTLWIESLETQVETWLLARGFQRGQVNPVTAAILDQATLEEWAARFPIPDEFEFITAIDLAARFPDEWLRMAYDFENLGMEDVPMPEPYVPEPFDAFCAGTLSELHDSSTVFYLMKEGELVCGTAFGRSKVDPTTAQTYLTTTLRAYRRRGLARAIKIRAMQVAESRGVKRLITDNEESNPMLQLNLALGFRPIMSMVNFTRSVH